MEFNIARREKQLTGARIATDFAGCAVIRGCAVRLRCTGDKPCPVHLVVATVISVD
jgi:hypothetical protein